MTILLVCFLMPDHDIIRNLPAHRISPVVGRQRITASVPCRPRVGPASLQSGRLELCHRRIRKTSLARRTRIALEVIDQRDVDERRYNDAVSKWHDQVVAHMRRAAVMVIERVRQGAERGGRTWAMKPDEVSLDPGCDETRIRDVLSIVGCDDEFDRIRDDALRAVEMPDGPGDTAAAGPMSPADEAELRAIIAQSARR